MHSCMRVHVVRLGCAVIAKCAALLYLWLPGQLFAAVAEYFVRGAPALAYWCAWAIWVYVLATHNSAQSMNPAFFALLAPMPRRDKSGWPWHPDLLAVLERRRKGYDN